MRQEDARRTHINLHSVYDLLGSAQVPEDLETARWSDYQALQHILCLGNCPISTTGILDLSRPYFRQPRGGPAP